MTDHNTSSQPEFTITRIFDAPRELVWRAWTDPAELARWHHPRAFSTPRETVSADIRIGGTYHYTMVDDATGERYPTAGVYLDVVEPELLQYSWGSPEDPVDNAPIATVKLVELGEKPNSLFIYAGSQQNRATTMSTTGGAKYSIALSTI